MPDHIHARKVDGRVYEHVYVMSKYFDRPLKKGETIHHKNGKRDDNRLENLELCLKGGNSHPQGQRVSDKIKWAISLLSEYAPTLLSKDKTILKKNRINSK